MLKDDSLVDRYMPVYQQTFTVINGISTNSPNMNQALFDTIEKLYAMFKSDLPNTPRLNQYYPEIQELMK